MPRCSRWQVAQFDTIRPRLITLAVRIEALKTQLRLHLPNAVPDQVIFALLLTRMPPSTSDPQANCHVATVAINPKVQHTLNPANGPERCRTPLMVPYLQLESSS